jgi:bifunctional non-homologous end joining protein LigD
MGLEEYRRKRDFARTPEPRGARARPRAERRTFVIQKHAARRLHYDFRLELGGVLKSWAVPKGPSLDPRQRHLAVETEDHPVEYGEFEGIIPAGEYGGGTVMIWDRGEWEPVGDPVRGLERGRLEFRLRGEKLAGQWRLVRMSGEGEQRNWLLLKSWDEAADRERDICAARPLSVASGRTLEEIRDQGDAVWREGKVVRTGAEATSGRSGGRSRPGKLEPARLPASSRRTLPRDLRPQLAQLVKRIPEGPGWLHEIKLDGYRLLGQIDGGRVRLLTRRGQDWTPKLPRLQEALAALPLSSAILDGELVLLRPDGTTSFQALQNALRDSDRGDVVFFAFDLPYCEGWDLRDSPLVERKRLLRHLLGEATNGKLVRYSDHVEGRGREFYQQACSRMLEGVISKRADSRYVSRRTRSWVKTKCVHRQEFVVVGYTSPAGERTGFGALLLGYHDDEGRLVSAGRVGTGFDQVTLERLDSRLRALRAEAPPLDVTPPARLRRDAHWVRPELVAEVEFLEWTEDGSLRHPSFIGLREDKPPEAIVREQPSDPPRVSGRGERAARAGTDSAIVASVRITNPDRVLYPQQGLTKVALARYWESVAEDALPHIAGRPLAVVRCPQGRERSCFYQKHVRERAPDGVRGVEISEKTKTEPVIVVDDVQGLVGLVQLGVLEVHPWGSTLDRLEQPDRVVFDLDPGPDVEFEAVIEGARTVRRLLDRLDLQSFVKTTGGKGLHVVVPLRPRAGWDEVRAFARAVAQAVVRDEPERYVATMSKAKRPGRIFVDYLRNGRGATSIAAFSTRAREGAPVSVPLRWSELGRLEGGDAYDVDGVLRRLRALRSEPWGDFSRVRQSLTRSRLKELGS